MKTLYLIFCLFVFNSLNSQINYLPSFELALKKAKEENKLIFVKYYGETCSHCQKLQSFLDQDTVYNKYNQYFVAYKINDENLKKEDLDLIKKYNFKIEGVPFMFFFDNEGKFIHFISPKLELSSILNIANNVLTPEKRSSYLPQLYASGIRDIVTLKMYSKLAQLEQKDSLIDILADDIFNNFNKNELLDLNGIVSCGKYVKSIKNGLFKIWMENYSKLDSVAKNYSLGEKQKIFKDILSNDINKNKKKWNLQDLELAKKYSVITSISSNPYINLWEEYLAIYLKENNETEALKVGYEMISNSDFHTAIYVCNTYLDKMTSKKAAEKVQDWSKILEQKYPSSENRKEIATLKVKIDKLLK